MPNEEDIIDAEVISETTHRVEDNDVKPKRVESDHSKQIARYARWSGHLFHFGRRFVFLGLALGLVFSILHSQSGNVAFLVLLIVFFSLSALSILAAILGYFFQRRMLAHMAQDPNFERYLD